MVEDKKKKGRKPKKNSKKTKGPPKKRGRKPKGGKILQATLNTTVNKVVKRPNIILHLKCSSQELFSKTNNNIACLDILADIVLDYFRERLLNNKFGYQQNAQRTAGCSTPTKGRRNKWRTFVDGVNAVTR